MLNLFLSFVSLVLWSHSQAYAETKYNFSKLGYYRVAAISPQVFVGRPLKNAEQIVFELEKIKDKTPNLIVFPELSLTGYTAEDLFLTDQLINETRDGLYKILQTSKKEKLNSSVIVVGAPIRAQSGRLFNTAVVMHDGRVLGIVPKIHLPNYAEFYEKRWFESGKNADIDFKDDLIAPGYFFSSQSNVKVSPNLLFKNGDAVIGIEICEDLWAPIPPSSNQALAGANVIVNLSASNELVGKATYRKNLIAQQSERLLSSYVYVSAGPTESTKDIVFGGHSLVYENGSLLAENKRFEFSGTSIVTDIDLQKITHERTRNKTYGAQESSEKFQLIDTYGSYKHTDLLRSYSKSPFVPTQSVELDDRSSEIISIQATGLARRLMATSSKKMVIGVSGGLDSTLALLVAAEAAKILNWGSDSIVGVTMPGFGTTSGTKTAAHELMAALGVKTREISIVPSVTQHLNDINHSIDLHNFVYENAQARMRTLILFDIANQENGIVVGTGDLSELCLGWCTYNGDHMASYGVNASIPKTLVKHLVAWYSKVKSSEALRSVLEKILNTEISPELLPPDKDGKIQQKTEDLVGPYELHDFFIFHLLRNGFAVEKIFILAEKTFEGVYSSEEIKKWLAVFIKRFSTQQFKRTTLPAGPKVGSVSVSPRGDLRLPDEFSCNEWLESLNSVKGIK